MHRSHSSIIVSRTTARPRKPAHRSARAGRRRKAMIGIETVAERLRNMTIRVDDLFWVDTILAKGESENVGRK